MVTKRKVVSAIEGALVLSNLVLGGLIYDQSRLTKEQKLELELQELQKQIKTSENREMSQDLTDCLFVDSVRESSGMGDWTLDECNQFKAKILRDYKEGKLPFLGGGGSAESQHE